MMWLCGGCWREEVGGTREGGGSRRQELGRCWLVEVKVEAELFIGCHVTVRRQAGEPATCKRTDR